MRNKKSFSFNEEEDAEKIYNKGFTNGVDYSKMYLISKFIRQTFGYGEIRLEKELINFCKKQDPYFNPIKESKTIRKWINSAMKYDLRKVESIDVSQKEIEFLKTITNKRDRKLLFTILVFAKALKKGNVRRKKTNLKTSSYYYIHYNNFSDIIQLTGLNNISESDLADILYTYKEHFTFYNAERELIRLDFIDSFPNKNFTVYNLDNITNHYNILFEEHGANTLCIICGKEIKKNSNRQKACSECSKILARQRKTKWRKKHKEEK